MVEKSNGKRKEQMEAQVEQRCASQPSKEETDEHNRIRVDSDDVANRELRQSVTHLNSPLRDCSNGAQNLMRNDVTPPNARSNDIQFNEIGAVLQEFDSPQNPTNLGHSTCPELSPHASTEDIHAKTNPMGIISSAFISELNSDLNSNEISNSARDNQKSPRVSLQATKPHWIRIVCVNNKPSEDISLGKLSKGKRTAALIEDHSKLPNKCYQVSRSKEDASIELAEADTQPCQSP